jgi:hypothetical protein
MAWRKTTRVSSVQDLVTFCFFVDLVVVEDEERVESERRIVKEIPSVSAVELVGNRIPEEGKTSSLLARKREGGLPQSPDPNRP